MFITINLDENRLNQEGIQQMSNELSGDLRLQMSDELKQYAAFRSLEQAAADAKSRITSDALQRAFTDHEAEASGGKTIEHEGLRFQVQRTPVYNFEQKRDWQSVHKQLEEAQKRYEAAKAAQKAVEKQLVLADKVDLVDVKVVLRYLPR